MEHPAYVKLEALAREPERLAATVEYVAERLRLFVKEREHVLICFPQRKENELGGIFEQAVNMAGGMPVHWGPDHRWKTLLRQSFATRATTIIGPPLVILGLSKLAKATGTPLNIRNVLTAGYPCLDWMIDGIVRGLDCRTWGCFGPGTGALVSGFSCGRSRGVHIREDVYEIDIIGPDGKRLPEGEAGEIVVSAKEDPDTRFPIMDRGRLDRSPCPCGCDTVRLMDIGPGKQQPPDLLKLGEDLHSWTSILDCRLEKGQYGLEMELVVFPGEKLPKLPTCAKRVIRAWDPEKDEPFSLFPGWEKYADPAESH